MKKMMTILSATSLMLAMTACGVQEDQDSGLTSVAAPNLKASAPNFRCGQGVVVIEVTNVGNADARSSFLRLDQTFASSQAFNIKALKTGETARQAITVKYKDGQLNATLRADANNNVAESNENDNILQLVCEG